MVMCHFSCSPNVASLGSGGGVSSGAGAEVVGEEGRTVDEEADEAERGVETLAGSCGDRPPTTAERRKR